MTTVRVEHHAALKIKDIPEFYKKLDGFNGRALTRLAIEFIILTFGRSNELRGATWEEFELDGENPIWRIPAERMKMSREHIVPLSSEAIGVLTQIRD